ncbi:hypothetical protein PPACK8108_LOCUS21158 [Phakopsora pachyrhizi]|uniref:J domain-containing protein n=2 Tax=Phakopsora pachyrhizi TaxID=170000 RepID=A0AAV0BKL2_PHAPC|nr:hypothetical protein PPACK8108_LOCUS21158 [Phakopsora pachyrhizi]
MKSVLGWDADDYEIFDLVSALEASEGKGVTFYKFLNVTKSATLAEINKASRKASLTLHPDKNPNVKDIQARFARLGVITAILRDPEKRKRYDFFHDNGVPRWKGTGYMYSRWQPGLGFAVSFVLGVATIMQYAAQHANYRSELSRIQKFQVAAKQAAYGNRKSISPNSNKTSENEKQVEKPLEKKKVKILMSKILSNDGETTESDFPAPKSRQERRRMQQQSTSSSAQSGGKASQSEWLNFVVEGDQVWIIAEDGSELPLTEEAASKPALKKTFIPATILKVFGRFIPSEQQAEATSLLEKRPESDEKLTLKEDGEAISTGVSTEVPSSKSGAGQAKKRKGASLKK